MGDNAAPLTGPDLSLGIESARLAEGEMLLGHSGGEAVLLVRPAGGTEVFAIGAACTHYGGPLSEGLLVGHELRCPWHHACFDVRSGAAVAAPALRAASCWRVEREGSRLVVREPRAPTSPAPALGAPEKIVIVGAGAAGQAAAEMLRTQGHAGSVTLIGADTAPPVDRPNLSKDYLAGTAPEEWVPLRDQAFYAAERIELVLGQPVTRLDLGARRVLLSDGTSHAYDALLLATGADPVRPPIPGADAPHVFYLRSLADSRAIIARATRKESRRAVIVGAGFIGLEVAASLRTRGLEADVVAPEAHPLERVLGPELGDFIRKLHETRGVRFHLGRSVRSIEENAVALDDGQHLPADLVVVGVGVRPGVALAEQAGLAVDRGVLVDAYLETSAPGVYAAGDVARFIEPLTGKRIRIEHWVVAERQGQTAARNMLGRKERFSAVPFFWSQHYDVPIAYVGHAEGWEYLDVAGSIPDGNCLVAFRSGGRIAAVATISRDRESLEAELLLERDDQDGLEALLARARG